MAIRSIGSSLVAKASPGSVSRKTTEERIANPQIPGKGVPGSTERGFVEEPFLQAVPGGSERIVRVAPGAEAVSQASPVVPETAGLMTGSVGRAPETPSLRSGANNQALFQGGVSAPSAAPMAKGGKVAKVTGMTSNLPNTTRPVAASAAPQGQVMGAQAPTYERASFAPTVAALGGRAAADEPNAPVIWTPTTGQYLMGKVGQVINKVGQALGNPLPETGFSERSQSFGGARSVQQQKTGSVKAMTQNALRSVVNAITQSQPAQQLRSQANNAVNKLKSIFKW